MAEINECKSAADKEHCWHSGSNADVASLSSDGSSETKTNYMCCWCAETKVVSVKVSSLQQKAHGPNMYPPINNVGIRYPL